MPKPTIADEPTHTDTQTTSQIHFAQSSFYGSIYIRRKKIKKDEEEANEGRTQCGQSEFAASNNIDDDDNEDDSGGGNSSSSEPIPKWSFVNKRQI